MYVWYTCPSGTRCEGSNVLSLCIVMQSIDCSPTGIVPSNVHIWPAASLLLTFVPVYGESCMYVILIEGEEFPVNLSPRKGWEISGSNVVEL